MNKDFEKLKELFVQVFLFISKTKIEEITSGNLNKDEYFLIMIGVGIVIAVVTWFFLGMVFKILGYFKN